MRLTRRELAAAGLALGTGCLSGGSNVRYPDAAAAEGEPLVEEDGSTAAATDGTSQAPPNPGLAPITRGIYTETRWFASGYAADVRAYQSAVDKALSTVERVREQGDVNENTLGVVETALDRLLSVVEARIEPHFGVSGYVRTRTTKHLETARTFAGRGDIDRAQEELGRLATFLENVGRGGFVDRNMSRNPVRNRLLSFLGRPGQNDDDGDDDEEPGVLFEVWEDAGDFTTYVYGGPSRIDGRGSESGGAFDERDRSLYGSQFAPAVSDEREGAVYVLVRRLPTPSNQPEPLVPERYPATGLVVQRFGDVAAASEARRALTEDGPMSVEGTARLGQVEADRVFYRAAGDVTYAFVFQTAELLVAVAPSEVAWNERIGWTRALQQTWLWDARES